MNKNTREDREAAESFGTAVDRGTDGAAGTSSGVVPDAFGGGSPPDPPLGFLRCPDCNGIYKGKGGLGVHRQRAHRAKYEEEKGARAPRHHVWRDEERRLLAREELRLLALVPPPKNINQALQASFPDWSIESIKGQRNKSKAYSDIFDEFKREGERSGNGTTEVQRPGGAVGRPAQDPDAHALEETNPDTDLPTQQGDPMDHVALRGGGPDRDDPDSVPANQSLERPLETEAGDIPAADVPGPIENVESERQNSEQDHMAQLSWAFKGFFELHREDLGGIFNGEVFVDDRVQIERWISEKVEHVFGITVDASTPPKGKGKARRPPPETETRRQRKARLRQLTLEFYERDPNACGKAILADTIDTRDTVPEERKEAFWTDVFEKETAYSGNIPEPLEREYNWRLSHPISKSELDSALEKMTESASGLDGVTLADIRSCQLHTFVLILNVMWRTNVIPKWLSDGRVTLIPKVAQPQSPKDFRPITVSSMLLRVFHRILARRLDTLVIDEAQVAYRQVDGCQTNLFILSSILRDSHQNREPLFAIFVDVAKAFDSVSRGAILAAAKRKGLPPPFLSYLENIFNQSGVWVGKRYCKQNNGVRQGDPMSGALFNFVMDYVYSQLSEDVGYPLREHHPDGSKSLIALIRHLLFADDGVIFANSLQGLDHQVQRVVRAFAECGMKLNPSKSMVLGKVPAGGGDKAMITAPESQAQLLIDGEKVPVMTTEGSYKYLGLLVGPRGFLTGYPESLLDTKLDRLQKSALKPQQKLQVLRRQVICSIMYAVTLGEVSHGRMLAIDKSVRKFVRKICHLPHDTPNSALHADMKAGGLGVTSLALTVPINRARRLARLFAKPGPIVQHLKEVSHCIKKFDEGQRIFSHNGVQILTKKDAVEGLGEELHKKVDGFGLKPHARCRQFDQWLYDCKMSIKGREFVLAVKTRLGCLNTPSRALRGGRGRTLDDKLCWRDRQPATLNHISQYCDSTHGLRVERHDQVVKMIHSSLSSRGNKTLREPRLAIENDRVLIPDIVTIDKERKAVSILDPIICSDFKNLEEVSNIKREKYNCEPLKKSACDRILGEERPAGLKVHVSGLAFNCRGAVAPSTHSILRTLCSRRYCAYIILRILVWTAQIVSQYRRTVHVSRRRGEARRS